MRPHKRQRVASIEPADENESGDEDGEGGLFDSDDEVFDEDALPDGILDSDGDTEDDGRRSVETAKSKASSLG